MINYRIALIAMATLGAGCATLPATPSTPADVAVIADPAWHWCGSSPKPHSVRLKLVNRGTGTLRVYIDTKPGLPYKLSWLAYEVLSDSVPGDGVDWHRGPGGHGPIPQAELNIGPDDSAVVVANIYDVDRTVSNTTFRIRISDLTKQEYLSNSFHLCPPSAKP